MYEVFKKTSKKNFNFNFNCLKAKEPLRANILLFTNWYPGDPGTHFIDLGRMKGWVDLGATLPFWTRNLWFGEYSALNNKENTDTDT